MLALYNRIIPVQFYFFSTYICKFLFTIDTKILIQKYQGIHKMYFPCLGLDVKVFSRYFKVIKYSVINIKNRHTCTQAGKHIHTHHLLRNSKLEGIRTVLILPGNHTVKIRCVPKGLMKMEDLKRAFEEKKDQDKIKQEQQ